MSLNQAQKSLQGLNTKKNKRKNGNQGDQMKFGAWNSQQSVKYYLFVYHHRQTFKNSTLRKSLKIFKNMSYFIKSRSSSQCRTHHQSLMSQFDSLNKLIEKYQEQCPNFLKIYKDIQDQLNILDDEWFCEHSDYRKNVKVKNIDTELQKINEIKLEEIQNEKTTPNSCQERSKIQEKLQIVFQQIQDYYKLQNYKQQHIRQWEVWKQFYEWQRYMWFIRMQHFTP